MNQDDHPRFQEWWSYAQGIQMSGWGLGLFEYLLEHFDTEGRFLMFTTFANHLCATQLLESTAWKRGCVDIRMCRFKQKAGRKRICALSWKVTGWHRSRLGVACKSKSYINTHRWGKTVWDFDDFSNLIHPQALPQHAHLLLQPEASDVAFPWPKKPKNPLDLTILDMANLLRRRRLSAYGLYPLRTS